MTALICEVDTEVDIELNQLVLGYLDQIWTSCHLVNRKCVAWLKSSYTNECKLDFQQKSNRGGVTTFLLLKISESQLITCEHILNCFIWRMCYYCCSSISLVRSRLDYSNTKTCAVCSALQLCITHIIHLVYFDQCCVAYYVIQIVYSRPVWQLSAPLCGFNHSDDPPQLPSIMLS